MTDYSLLSVLAAALGGGVAVKLLDIGYGALTAWTKRRSDDAKTIEVSLEPLLRAADELVGKLRSLAEQDFLPVRRIQANGMNDPTLASVVYLFVQFWSEIEIVRFRGLSAAVSRSRRGQRTHAFLACLESRKVRLIDRISQRAAGEAALEQGRTMNYVEFIKAYDADAYVERWLSPLIAVLTSLDAPDVRQKLLQYAVVLHALVDTLDRNHLITKDRPATPNKLSVRSWQDLNYRVFNVYLPFVADRQKYIGPPKRRP